MFSAPPSRNVRTNLSVEPSPDHRDLKIAAGTCLCSLYIVLQLWVSPQCNMQLPAGNSHISDDTWSVFCGSHDRTVWYSLWAAVQFCTCQSQQSVRFVRNSAPTMACNVPHIRTVQVTTHTLPML